MQIEGSDKCENGSNTNNIEEHIKKLCRKGACNEEFKDYLFPRKFIRIKYICEGNNIISRRGFMQQIQCNKCDISYKLLMS